MSPGPHNQPFGSIKLKSNACRVVKFLLVQEYDITACNLTKILTKHIIPLLCWLRYGKRSFFFFFFRTSCCTGHICTMSDDWYTRRFEDKFFFYLTNGYSGLCVCQSLGKMQQLLHHVRYNKNYLNFFLSKLLQANGWAGPFIYHLKVKLH